MQLPLQTRSWYRIAFALVGLITMVIVRLPLLRGGEISSWVEVSAWVLLLVGAIWIRNLEARFSSMVKRLFHREAVVAPDDTASSLLKKIERRAALSARIGAVVIPFILIIAYFYVWTQRHELGEWFPIKITLELVAGYLVGDVIGRVITYGCLGLWLQRAKVSVQVKLGHPDGAGGLKVVGDYFLYQAGMVMLAAVFFGFWWVVTPAWPDSAMKHPTMEFGEWRGILGVFFLVTLAIEVVAFLAPMKFIHGEMVRHSERFSGEADAIGNAIIDLEEQMSKATQKDEFEGLLGKRGILEARFQLLEQAPTWPFDSGVRHRFAWGNAAVVAMPIIAKLPSSPEVITKTLENLLALK